jgi:hypothetical protein
MVADVALVLVDVGDVELGDDDDDVKSNSAFDLGSLVTMLNGENLGVPDFKITK